MPCGPVRPIVFGTNYTTDKDDCYILVSLNCQNDEY